MDLHSYDTIRHDTTHHDNLMFFLLSINDETFWMWFNGVVDISFVNNLDISFLFIKVYWCLYQS
jgi:hypothetical protein